MEDKTVRDAFLDTVMNQLETGDPPETKVTYDRLLLGGVANTVEQLEKFLGLLFDERSKVAFDDERLAIRAIRNLGLLPPGGVEIG